MAVSMAARIGGAARCSKKSEVYTMQEYRVLISGEEMYKGHLDRHLLAVLSCSETAPRRLDASKTSDYHGAHSSEPHEIHSYHDLEQLG